MENERVMIFVDGSNMFCGIRDTIGDISINYEKLLEKLCGERRLVRTYFYIAPILQKGNEENYKKQQKFFTVIDNVPYLTRKLGRLQKRGNTWIEKGVDVQIAVDMLLMAVNDLYDTAILISGDGDFAYVIEAIKNMGKHVEIAYVSQTYNLRPLWDRFIHFTEEYLRDCIHSAD